MGQPSTMAQEVAEQPGALARTIDALGSQVPEVRALGGADVEFRASLARHAHARLGQDPEGVLLAAPTTLVQVQKDEYVLQTYSPYDLQAIPKPLVAVLELFDGRPTPEVVTAAAERGVTLDPPTLRRMVEVGLLSEHS